MTAHPLRTALAVVPASNGPLSPHAAWLLTQEAHGLLARLAWVKPFALIEPMLPAASLLPAAQTAVERYLMSGRRQMRAAVRRYLVWLRGAAAAGVTAAQAQQRFTVLRLQFNAVLTQFDLFNDAISQRSEHETGTYLSGLDVVSADALRLPGNVYQCPPVICYLDRGAGAAIRRARTRLPGGGENPVAIIRVPRERMVGSGIASSLVHEIGHQAAALLDLVPSLRPVLQGMQHGAERAAWVLWERWISEVVADFWAIARVGIASTLGLIAIVSLPRRFVFRISLDDPHPAPWIRVMLSCAIGQALYPHPQWQRIADVWQSFYPLQGVDEAAQGLIGQLQATMPAFVSLLLHHRPRSLQGRSLPEALQTFTRRPERLAQLFRHWNRSPPAMYRAPPSLVFAALGQARADGQLTPFEEGRLLGKLLTHWALRSTLQTASDCVLGRPATPIRQHRWSTVQ
jgi:hypothetical protein